MSFGDSMRNPAAWPDNINDTASSAAMATLAAFGSTMISKTGRIKTNRTTHLLVYINDANEKAKAMPLILAKEPL
jgi:hypothetical protein